jgi:hypothetical protein
MKKRYLYSLLFAVPGFFVSLIIAFALFGAAAGFLWIFVFGDNTWPEASGNMLTLLLVIVFLVLWVTSIVVGFVSGKKLEAEPELNRKHVLASVGLTIVPIIFIALHQFNVGNLGPKTDGQLCLDYCLENGYSGSGTPPKNSGDRSCFCYDNTGREVLNVPIESIIPAE